MLRLFACAIVFSVMAVSAPAATVINGDFETGDFSGWTVGTTGNGETEFSTVSLFDTDGLGASNAASFRVGQVSGNGMNEGITLSQTLSIGSAGAYSFAADVAALGGPNYFNRSGGVFELIVGGDVLDVFDTNGISSGATERDGLAGEVELAVGDVELTIRITRPFLRSDETPFQFVDNVTAEYLAPVPLPAGLPLLVVGLGGLALLRRRS